VFVDSDQNANENGNQNVTAFPKAKKSTPDDWDTLPLAHICSEVDNIQCFKWCIHMRGTGLWFLCTNCGLDMSLEEVLESYQDYAK
jgi:hypothetical protein